MRYVACKEFDSSVVIDGSKCITTMGDLYRSIVDKETTDLYIRSDFASEYFTPTSLSDFVKNVKKLNGRVNVESDALSVTYLVDQVKKLKSLKTTPEFIFALEKNPKDVLNVIDELCRFYVGSYSETLEANNKVSSQHLKIMSLQRQLEEKEKSFQELSERYNEMETRLHILLSRINYQYGHNINLEELLDAEGNRYDKVLYVKEFTRVHYVDTFLYYLQEILRTLYGVPCRMCVMEPFYAYDRVNLYKGMKPSWDMTADDVYSSDIFMAGYQPRLIEDILKNSSNVRYLIVLDRLGDFGIHVHGSNVEEIYTVSDVNDLGKCDFMDRIISYNADTLNIPHIQGFDARTNAEKMSLYSSMQSMQSIIELLERR